MKKIAKIAMAVTVLVAVAFSGCTSVSTSYQQMMENARRQIEEQKKQPLAPLPHYAETTARYGTSARILLVGDDAVCKPLSAALKDAGFAVSDEGDMQAAAFRRPDFILYPTVWHRMEYGDGSAWTRTHLVVSVRRPLTMGRNGVPLPSAPPRAFQAYARTANPNEIEIISPSQRSEKMEMLALYENLLDAETYAKYKQITEKSMVGADGQAAKAMGAVLTNLMRVAPFREMLANP